ncbi:MAG TPA: TadE/TadG family type IV pilus assembly protein [Rhizobiaceae bacterium]|nr:TadE/TadG family type IV pilus assembly protein [Rhizobiaceae bacterium]
MFDIKALMDVFGLRRLQQLWQDQRGVAALEFALIAPLLLSLYLVTMEVSQGIETNKKVSRVGSMVADLITQQDKITTTELDAIMAIGESILQPYNRTKPTIIITAIQISNDATPKVEVEWSRKLVNGDYSADALHGDPTTVPEKLKIKDSFLIRVQSNLSYSPVITWGTQQKKVLGLTAAFDGISMAETYYLRPRMSASIPCSNCY